MDRAEEEALKVFPSLNHDGQPAKVNEYDVNLRNRHIFIQGFRKAEEIVSQEDTSGNLTWRDIWEIQMLLDTEKLKCGIGDLLYSKVAERFNQHKNKKK